MCLFVRSLSLLVIILLESCSSSRQNLVLHALPNYDAKAAHQILFMDFTVNLTKPEKPEQIILANAIVGAGELKNIGGLIHSPYQIKLVRYYTDNQQPDETSLEHPLFQSIEVASSDGTLRRTVTRESDGHFSVRCSYTNTLSKIELYSVMPDKDAQKIYTLHLKP